MIEKKIWKILIPLIDAVRWQLYKMANSPTTFPLPILQINFEFLITSNWPSNNDTEFKILILFHSIPN